MSLLVWLPLTNGLANEGLADITMTNNGATEVTNGKLGKCYSFSSSSIDGTLSNFNKDCWSAACWALATTSSSSGHQYMVGLNTSTASDFTFTLCWYSDKFSVRTGNTTYQSTVTGLTNVWTHVCATYDGTDLKLYINGVLDRTVTSPVAPVTASTLILGKRGGNAGSFTGSLNDVRVYDHVLSQKEVSEIAKGLIVHYKLNGGTSIVLPTGYQQLEYISSSGTQYIDTGKLPQDSYEYRFKFALSQFSGYKGPFGSYSGSENINTTRIIDNNGSSTTLLVYFISKPSGGNKTATNIMSATNQIIEGTLSKKHYYLKNLSTGSEAEESNATDLFPTKGTGGDPSANMILFGANTTNLASARFYYFSTYDNGICIQNLIPAQNSNGTVGMYDTISNTFFTNAGSGTFTSGSSKTISGTTYDCSGNGYEGIIEGTLATNSNTPRYSHSTNFNGSTNYIEADPLPAETYTISCWLKWNSVPSSGTYSVPVHDTQSQLAIGYSSGKLITFVGSSAGGTGSAVTFTPAVNVWYHIVVVKTGSTTRDVYINTVKATTTTNNYWAGDLIKLDIGCRHNSSGYNAYFNGSMSDFRAYATALSEANILELYNTSSTIDNVGNILPRELDELTTNGNLFTSDALSSYAFNTSATGHGEWVVRNGQSSIRISPGRFYNSGTYA